MRKIVFFTMISIMILVLSFIWIKESKADSDIGSSYYDPMVPLICIGKVQKPIDYEGQMYITFDIIKAYKGCTGEKDTSSYHLKQRENDPFIEGKEYLVCLKSKDGEWNLDSSTGTKLISEAGKEIEELENILKLENEIVKLVETNIYGQLAQNGAIVIAITKEMKEIMEEPSEFIRPIKVREGEIVKFAPFFISKEVKKNNDIYSVYVDSTDTKNFLQPAALIFEVQGSNGKLKISNTKFIGYHLRQTSSDYSFEKDPNIIMIRKK